MMYAHICISSNSGVVFGKTQVVTFQVNRLGAVTRSVPMPLEMQSVPRSTPASGIFFREDLVMKIFLRPFFLFCWLLNKVDRFYAKHFEAFPGTTDRPDMASAVYRERETINQTISGESVVGSLWECRYHHER